jgi:hypothetical protein
MPEDVKAAEVIWGQSVIKMKGNTVRRTGKRTAQSIIKVPKELIKLQQDVESEIDCFFVNKHIFSPLTAQRYASPQLRTLVLEQKH